MKNIVLFTTRPITSKYTKSLIEQMCILKEYQDKGYNITLVTPKTSPRNKEYIETVAGITISKVVSYAKDYSRTMLEPLPIYPTWGEFLEKEDWFKDIGQVDEIVFFGAMLSSSSGLTRATNKIDNFLLTRGQMNFQSVGSFLSGTFQLVKLSRERKIPIHEICYDPCENSLSQLTDYPPYKLYCYHGYDWPDYKLERLDSLQSYLPKETISFGQFFEEETPKDLDLCFGFTALTKHREKQYDDLMGSLNDSDIKMKLFIRHKKLNIDTFVGRDLYLSNIKRSRYTLIIPPYDLKHFSVYRFIESIQNDCLPLITEDVNVDDFIKSFNIPTETINKIRVEYSTIGNKINELDENERRSLLTYFKEICLTNERKLKIGL